MNWGTFGLGLFLACGGLFALKSADNVTGGALATLLTIAGIAAMVFALIEGED